MTGCSICGAPLSNAIALCRVCHRAFNRDCDGVDMATIIQWVAARTLRFTPRLTARERDTSVTVLDEWCSETALGTRHARSAIRKLRRHG